MKEKQLACSAKLRRESKHLKTETQTQQTLEDYNTFNFFCTKAYCNYKSKNKKKTTMKKHSTYKLSLIDHLKCIWNCIHILWQCAT